MTMLKTLSTTISLVLATIANAQQCKTVPTVANFDISAYTPKPWYSQEQAESVLSQSQN